jgi:hypothetical protein
MLNGSPAVLVASPAPPGQAPRFVSRIDLGRDGTIREIHTILATRKLTGVNVSGIQNPESRIQKDGLT